MKHNLTPMTKWERTIGWPYLLIQLLFIPVAVVFVDYQFKLQLSDALLNVVLFTLDFVLIIAIFHRFLLKELQLALSRIGKVLFTALIGFLLYWLLNIAVSILSFYLQPQHINANDQAIGEMAAQEYALMAIGTVLLVPITEETLFRGLIFGTLYRKNAALGYIVSVILFAAVHVLGYIGSQDHYSLLISFIQYLPAGLALCWSYARSETIWTPILIHAAVNCIGISAMR